MRAIPTAAACRIGGTLIGSPGAAALTTTSSSHLPSVLGALPTSLPSWATGERCALRSDRPTHPRNHFALQCLPIRLLPSTRERLRIRKRSKSKSKRTTRIAIHPPRLPPWRGDSPMNAIGPGTPHASDPSLTLTLALAPTLPGIDPTPTCSYASWVCSDSCGTCSSSLAQAHDLAAPESWGRMKELEFPRKPCLATISRRRGARMLLAWDGE
jgi:hypothetical protein